MSEEILSEGPFGRALYDAHENFTISLSDMQPRVSATDRHACPLSERARRTARFGEDMPAVQLSGRDNEVVACALLQPTRNRLGQSRIGHAFITAAGAGAIELRSSFAGTRSSRQCQRERFQ